MKKLLTIALLMFCSFQGFSQAMDTLYISGGNVWYASKFGNLQAGKDVYRDFFSIYNADGTVTVKNNSKVLGTWKFSDIYIAGTTTIAQKKAYFESNKLGMVVTGSGSSTSALPANASQADKQDIAKTALDLLHTDLANNATTTLQSAGNTSLSTIATNSGTQATSAKQDLAKTALDLLHTDLANNATTTLQTAGNTSLSTIATNSGTQATSAKQDIAKTALDLLHTDLTSSLPAVFGTTIPTVTAYTTAGNTISTTNCIKVLVENESITTNGTITYGGKIITIGFKGNVSGYSTFYSFDAPYDVASKKYSPFASMVIDALTSNIYVTKIFTQ